MIRGLALGPEELLNETIGQGIAIRESLQKQPVIASWTD